jgi:hypothetical protein
VIHESSSVAQGVRTGLSADAPRFTPALFRPVHDALRYTLSDSARPIFMHPPRWCGRAAEPGMHGNRSVGRKFLHGTCGEISENDPRELNLCRFATSAGRSR